MVIWCGSTLMVNPKLGLDPGLEEPINKVLHDTCTPLLNIYIYISTEWPKLD